MGNSCANVLDFELFLKNVLQSNICKGNVDPEMTNLVPDYKGISFKAGSKIDCYKEREFVKNDFSSSIRSTECPFLIDESRCNHCRKIRKTLLSKLNESSDNLSERDFTSNQKPNSFLSSPERNLKLKQYALKTQKLNK